MSRSEATDGGARGVWIFGAYLAGTIRMASACAHTALMAFTNPRMKRVVHRARRKSVGSEICTTRPCPKAINAPRYVVERRTRAGENICRIVAMKGGAESDPNAKTAITRAVPWADAPRICASKG